MPDVRLPQMVEAECDVFLAASQVVEKNLIANNIFEDLVIIEA